MIEKTTTSGVFNIDKPAGLTSHDVVNHVRQKLKVKGQKLPKVGHTGTLDPFATGVLLVVFGSATRLIQFTHAWEKEYEAQITLGAVSDTDDATGIITKNQPLRTNQISREKLQDTLKQFVGTITQIPPAYSAIKTKGKKMYELARAGHTEELKKIGESKQRSVTVYEIELLNYAWPQVTIRVQCSTGTYIRALARDIGISLGTGAYVSSLRRTCIGMFDISKSISLDKLSTGPVEVLPPENLVTDLPRLTLTSHNIEALRQGKRVEVASTAESPVALFDTEQHLIGIGQSNPADRTLSPIINL